MSIWGEEDVKRGRVKEIISKLRNGYKSRFGIEVSSELLLEQIDLQIEELKRAMVKEAISHLFIRHAFDPDDLMRAKEILKEEERPPAVRNEQEKRGRKRKELPLQ